METPTYPERGAEPSPGVAMRAAAARLARAGVESARLDAELLMAEAASLSREALIAGAASLDAAALARFERMVERRAAREPLAYIVGHREFFSLEFEVCPGVLVPRPETETLVECALEYLAGRPGATVLDLGTGSGAIAAALAKSAPGARIVATDISKVALEVAARNARRHGCAGDILLLEGDCFAPLAAAWDGTPFDLVVSNPPYIGAAEFAKLAPEVREFEPREALAGGGDGLEFYRGIAAGLSPWLRRGGAVMLEVGAGQAQAVESILRAAGLTPAGMARDLAGVDRVVKARGVP